MNGQLHEHPLAELVREISTAGFSGALRLERERVKVAIYFDEGEILYATSNMRWHRLDEALKRAGAISETQLAELGDLGSNPEIEEQLLRRGFVGLETLRQLRSTLVADILRTALLWTDGSWDFDARARLAKDLQTELKIEQLLMEAARRLPTEFVISRFNDSNDTISVSKSELNGTELLPVEAFVFFRVQEPLTLSQLTALSGVPEAEAMPAIYALTLGGLLARSAWPVALPIDLKRMSSKRQPVKSDPVRVDSDIREDKVSAARDEALDLELFFERLDRAIDHFEVLDVGRGASPAEIKRAYHTLARRFHPDRYHQSAAMLRARIESAFARIAQAYETLGDVSTRAAYEARLRTTPRRPADAVSHSAGANVPIDASAPSNVRAAAAFESGLSARKQNQYDAAVSRFAEAAHLEPREARYRAQYGQALAERKQTRRLAESELQTAVALEPNNASYRIMLAELYQSLSMRRRAQAELERALMADPKNKIARSMLDNLQQKK